MRDAALQGDCIILSAARRLAARRRIAALTVLDDFRRAFEHPDLAHPGDVAPIPLDAKFEILVWIKTLCVDAKLGHEFAPLDLDLSGELLNLDDDKLGWLEPRKADEDIHDAEIDA